MCKIPNITAAIKNLDFNAQRGKMAVKLTDGREMIVPLTMFPDIKKLSLKDRNDWMVLDDMYFTFQKLTRIYSITDIFRL